MILMMEMVLGGDFYDKCGNHHSDPRGDSRGDFRGGIGDPYDGNDSGR